MKRALLIGAASLALGACVAAPRKLPSATEVALPVAYRFAPDEGSSAGLAALLPGADPAYVALTKAALAGSPTLAAALARIDVARADASAARANRLPEIDGSASVARSRSSSSDLPDIPGVEIDRSRTTFGGSLTARWDADIFGGLRARQRADVARINAADADAAAVRLALLAEIAACVTDWRTLAEREDRLRRDLGVAERLGQLAGVRERAGLSPGIDRVQAESVAASSRTRLAALDSERARLLGRLVTLTAQPASVVEKALATPAAAPSLLQPPMQFPSTLLTNRPDILAAGARLRAADAEVAAAAAQRFPRLTLSGLLGLAALTLGDVFTGDAVRGSLGADLAGPLLDFGRVSAEIERGEARTFEAFANYRDAVFTALGDAEAGYATIAAADRELVAASVEAAASDRSAHLSETRYRAGLSNLISVLDSQRTALAAGERVATARGRALRARIALWQALGGA